MRAFSLLCGLTALVLAAAPAGAHPMGPHSFHPGFWGGPGLAFGLAGAAAAAAAAAAGAPPPPAPAAGPCIRTEPAFDAKGKYLGKRSINAC